VAIPTETINRTADYLRYPYSVQILVNDQLNQYYDDYGEEWLEKLEILLDKIDCAMNSLLDEIDNPSPQSYSLQGAYSVDFGANSTNGVNGKKIKYNRLIGDLINLTGLELYSSNYIIRN
jgi:hypothetical protein